MRYVIGADVGTSSLKMSLFNEFGEEIKSVSKAYTLDTHGNTVEFEADGYWSLFMEAMEEISEVYAVEGISIDTQCETLIVTDEADKPLRKAIVWLDNRATEQAIQIEQHFGVETIYNVTGQPEVTATWPACKLLWIRQNEPHIFSAIRKVFLLEDYLLFRLTGAFVTQKTLQSSSLYLDIRNGCWWKDMLDYIGIEIDMLPVLHNSGEIVGRYGRTAVVTGVMDQIAGAIGAGVVTGDTISEMTGTAMVILAPADSIPPYDSNRNIPCHLYFNNRYCLLSWTPTAGMALEWFKNNFCENYSFAELDELAASVLPGSEGVTFLPYLCGSVFPKYNPNACGVFVGLTLAHKRRHLVRSILESVACILKSNLDALDLSCKEIRSMGGAASSPLWCQIKADLTGRRLVTLTQKETACLGSAIIAAVGIGLMHSVEEACRKWVKTGAEYYPSGTDYTDVYQKFSDLEAKFL